MLHLTAAEADNAGARPSWCTWPKKIAPPRMAARSLVAAAARGEADAPRAHGYYAPAASPVLFLSPTPPPPPSSSAHPRRRGRFRLEACSSASTPAPAPATADEGSGAGPCPWSGSTWTTSPSPTASASGSMEGRMRRSSRPRELYGSTVVLRQLTSSQAKRRGRRALEVLKKLARRQMMYRSCAMQVHGYVTPGNAMEEGDGPFILVHGYHGSYSLHHWLQLSDWLPTLEATLAMDEEQVRRVGDDSVGGPAITQQLCLFRILMRDLLIVVDILGNAIDFHDNDPSSNTLASNSERRKMMIAFDMRCVGFIMAKMVLRELIWF